MADIYTAFRSYVTKMLTFQGSAKGTAKVLILDAETTQSIAVAFSQSEILEYDVFLTEKLGATHEAMQHLIAIVFIRPVEDNIKLLCAELKSPKYKEYHIYTSNILRSDLLSELAQADEKSLIKEVHEYYGDYIPIDKDHYTLNILDGMSLCRAPQHWKTTEINMLHRITDSILGVCLSLKQRPFIRYQCTSEPAGRLAREVMHQIEREDQKGNLFDFHGNCELIIMDRKSDPVTPLLTQWLYLAMVHEFFVLWNNRVKLRSSAGEDEFVMNAQTDPFLKEHEWSDFGVLSKAVKVQTTEFAEANKRNEDLLKNDMTTFVEEFKEFKLLELGAKRHVSLASELGRLVKQHNLTTISALEQSIVCNNDHGTQIKDLLKLIEDPNVSKEDCVRLVILYALKYEQKSGSKLSQMINALKDKGVPSEMMSQIDAFMSFSPSESRTGDLFGGNSLGSFVQGLAKSVKGVDNIYTQHTPVLGDILLMAKKKKLKDAEYVCEGPQLLGSPDCVIVFYIGGTTYEEGHTVSELNKSGQLACVLGGTHVLNSSMFLKGVKSIV